jgi:hypothetical protein
MFLTLVFVAKHSPRVEHIFTMRTPLKVRFMAVHLVAVLVIDLWFVLGIGNECFRYELVNALDFALARTVEGNNLITIRVVERFENFARLVVFDLTID